MFTDRFIRLPTKVFNVANKELTGKEDSYDCHIRINPLDICQYFEGYDNDDIEGVQVFLKSGDTVMIYLTIAEFEKRLNNHAK